MSVIEAMTNEGVLFVDKRDSWLMRADGAIVDAPV